MKFEHYQALKNQALAACSEEGLSYPDPGQMNPILLALIGDSVFSFYVRLRLLPVSGQVRVVHDIASKTVSAVMQAKAYHAIEDSFTEAEAAVVRRGRNAKSMVPKSATVAEYRASTAFEALLGWLLLTEQEERLEQVLKDSFRVIAAELKKPKK